MSDKVWIRNPRHRKYKPGEEADDVRKNDEEEANGEKDTDGEETICSYSSTAVALPTIHMTRASIQSITPTGL